MNIEEKLKELLADKEFATALLNMESAEQVQQALQEKGIELEIADIEAVRKLLDSPAEGELTDDALETVSGGSLTIMAAIGIASIITGAVTGTITLGNKVNSWTRSRW